MTISPSAVLITATSPTGLGLDFVSSLHAAKTRPNVKPNIPLRAIFNFMGWTFDTKLSQSHVRTVAWFDSRTCQWPRILRPTGDDSPSPQGRGRGLLVPKADCAN